MLLLQGHTPAAQRLRCLNAFKIWVNKFYTVSTRIEPSVCEVQYTRCTMFQLVSLQPFIVFPSCKHWISVRQVRNLYGCRCLLVYLCELMTLSSGVHSGLPTWWHLETKAVNISFRGSAGPLHVRRRKGTDEENHWVRILPSVAATKLWALIKDSYVYVCVINYFSRSL